MADSPSLYDSLASWWPLLSPPSEYQEEAVLYAELLRAHGRADPRTVLELGSGGGNNALWLKRSFDLTLVDLAPEMLAQSRALNLECAHAEGDMRTVRLGRTFDRVFIHDAICYMTTEDDLLRAMKTAFVHCRPSGAALFVPDFVRETFHEGTDTGGTDGPDRALRYLEWIYDPDPTDTRYNVDYAYLLREEDGTVRVELDQHVEGLFSSDDWRRLLVEAGFDPDLVTLLTDAPDKPVTQKPAETRMGSGKGNPERWVAVVKPGRILFELSYPDPVLAREAIDRAIQKLPIKARFVVREEAL